MPDRISVDGAAYHEAGHITAAVVQAMPIRMRALRIDLWGHGCAEYMEVAADEPGTTDADNIGRKRTIITRYAAHLAQERFHPQCETVGWLSDLDKIKALSSRLCPESEEYQTALQNELRSRAAKLVDIHWKIIDELARAVLAKPKTNMSDEEAKEEWVSGRLKREMTGTEVVAFFARHGIKAILVLDSVSTYDPTKDIPYYESLA